MTIVIECMHFQNCKISVLRPPLYKYYHKRLMAFSITTNMFATLQAKVFCRQKMSSRHPPKLEMSKTSTSPSVRCPPGHVMVACVLNAT